MTKLLFILLFLSGCSPTEPENVHGCLDSQACNYNSDATIDNNSCIYVEDCNGVCGGDALLDNCDVCDEDTSNDCTQDCNGVWGGDNEGWVILWSECYNIENTTSIGLGITGLSGEISTEIGLLENLTYLDLENNNLSGELYIIDYGGKIYKLINK